MDSLTVIANDSGNEIVSMQGIEHFYALNHLTIYGGKFASLDLSHNTALEDVSCYGGVISSLNISGCSALKSIDCSNNQLQSLDISHNPALEHLICGGNKLTSLSTSNNPALVELDCSENQIKTLDVSHSTALTCLNCSGNKLSSINITANSLLAELRCGFNNLSSLNLSHNKLLNYLACEHNQLPYIDLSHNTALETVVTYPYQVISNQELAYVDDDYVYEWDHMVPDPSQMSMQCFPPPEYNSIDRTLVFPEFLEEFSYYYPTGWGESLLGVTVCFKPYKPSIVLQPKDATVAAGDTAFFKIKGKYAFREYQWQKSSDGGETWDDIIVALYEDHISTIEVYPAGDYDGCQYRCIVSNESGEVISDTAKLRAIPPLTISLNANGGTCEEASVEVNYGHEYGELPTPTRTGYEFAGWWTTKATGGKQVTAETVCKATGNFTMYARWTPKTYTVTLNANGGVCATPNVTVTYDQAYGTLPTPTRTGYEFAGWWTTKATGNFTMYARWTPKTYTVTLNANGGSCTQSNVTVTYDKAYGTLPTPTRTGYTLAGWWTTKETGGKQVTKDTVCKATGNFTLFARWTALASYTVTLNPNGGSCTTPSITVYYSQTYGTLPTPTRRGYKFAGWWTTKTTGGKQVTKDTVCYATGNFTMYARWTALASYTVTLNPNGGTCDKSSITVYYSQVYGDSLPTGKTTIREGYTFDGWWTTKTTGGKQVTASTVCYATGNYTLYARWTEH